MSGSDQPLSTYDLFDEPQMRSMRAPRSTSLGKVSAMAIRYIEAAPRRVQFFEKPKQQDATVDVAERLTPSDVTHIAEIFSTPLTGSYNWDYRTADDRISKLYELGKRLNWNA